VKKSTTTKEGTSGDRPVLEAQNTTEHGVQAGEGIDKPTEPVGPRVGVSRATTTEVKCLARRAGEADT